MNKVLILVLSAVVMVSGSAVTTLEVGIGKVSNGRYVCVLIDGNGELTATDGFTLNNSAHEEKLVCKAGVINTTGKAIRYDSDHSPFSAPGMMVPCFDGDGGITNSWKEVIKPSGEAVMQCSFKK